MRFGSLFAGIGGFDLGFERAGMTCAWQVEIDDYCNRVLAKHWPSVPRYGDIRTFPPSPTEDWRVDLICGGFPCQDISYAGRGAGLEGERSGLFFEALRVVRQLRPKVVVLENVAALLSRGLDRVCGELAEVGYDAQWHCIPAAAVGAPHIRDRLFVLADANHDNGHRRRCIVQVGRLGCSQTLAADRKRNRTQWGVEPDVGRVAHGVPARVDRLRGLGNAVVPQVAEYIGEQLMRKPSPALGTEDDDD